MTQEEDRANQMAAVVAIRSLARFMRGDPDTVGISEHIYNAADALESVKPVSREAATLLSRAGDATAGEAVGYVDKVGYEMLLAGTITSLLVHRPPLRYNQIPLFAKPRIAAPDGVPPIIAPMPTLEDGREVLTTAISDSIKATSVLSTMLRKLDLKGYAVADELLGNLQVAYECAKRLPFAPTAEPVAWQHKYRKANGDWSAWCNCTKKDFDKIADDPKLAQKRALSVCEPLRVMDNDVNEINQPKELK